MTRSTKKAVFQTNMGVLLDEKAVCTNAEVIPRSNTVDRSIKKVVRSLDQAGGERNQTCVMDAEEPEGGSAGVAEKVGGEISSAGGQVCARLCNATLADGRNLEPQRYVT